MNKIKMLSLLAAAAMMTGSVAMAETYSADGQRLSRRNDRGRDHRERHHHRCGAGRQSTRRTSLSTVRSR